jgi:hypothetical protein
MSSSRAQRNANPGNIDAHDAWQGLLPRAQMTPEQAAEPRFAVFAAPKWGFRAMAIILLNYVRVHHLKTVREIISRWAPSVENPTEGYVKAVSGRLGVGPDTPLDFTKPDLLAALVKAIAIHESGLWLFSDADLKAGVALAEGNQGALVA